MKRIVGSLSLCVERSRTTKRGFLKANLCHKVVTTRPSQTVQTTSPVDWIHQVSFKGYPRDVTFIPFSFTSCLKLVLTSSPDAPNPVPNRLCRVRRFMNHVRHLQIRSVSQGVVCVLDSRLFFWVCLFTYPHGSTLYIILCVSFPSLSHDDCSRAPC